jgi:hypothetical protein
MTILVAILIIAAVAGAAYFVIRSRRGGARDLRERRGAPTVRATREVPPSRPLEAAVVEHAQVTDPRDVAAAEQRLQAEARQVAASMNADARRVEADRGAAGTTRVNGHAVDDRYVAGDRYAADDRYAAGDSFAAGDGEVVDDRFAGPAPTDPQYADPDQAVRDYRAPAHGDPADPRYDETRDDDRR